MIIALEDTYDYLFKLRSSKYFIKRNATGFVLIALIYLMSFLLPNFDLVISLTGTTATCVL
jgi:hypothetical protein